MRASRGAAAAAASTNLQNEGLISADRSNEATLPLTIPRSRLGRLQRIYQSTRARLTWEGETAAACFRPPPLRTSHRILETRLREARSIRRFLRLSEWTGARIIAPSMDSGLEAFSRNPAGGSFGAMAFPPAPKTRDLDQRFLSY